MLHVGELHAQAVPPAVVGAEVHPGNAVGGDLLELPFGGTLFPGGEQAVRELGRQGLGDVADPGVVGGARRRGEPEPGTCGDDQAAGGSRLPLGLAPHLRLPPLHTGDVDVTVTCHSPAPQPGDEVWEEIVEVSLHSVSGEPMVRGLMDDLDEELPVLSLVGPGDYRPRSHARGWETAIDLAPDDPRPPTAHGQGEKLKLARTVEAREPHSGRLWPSGERVPVTATASCGWLKPAQCPRRS